MKTAVVTGGAGGIGSAICRRLSKDGYFVVVAYHSQKEAAKALAAEIGGRALYVDVRDENAVAAFAATVGKVHLLINNAGIAEQKLFTDITPDAWDHMFSVHIRGAYLLSRAFLPYMLHEKSGSIINISSIWGITGASCEVHYSAAKAALIGFTKALAKELGPSGITVNCIAPGVIATDMLSSFSEDEKKALVEETPIGRLGTPEDVAEAVSYAAGASFLTGQVISPSGGFVI